MNANTTKRKGDTMKETRAQGGHAAHRVIAHASLPDAIEYRGRHYGKSSWNSDTMTACYRTDKPLAKVYYVNQ